MKHLKKQCQKNNFRPVCIQLTFACVISFIITLVWLFFYSILGAYVECRSINVITDASLLDLYVFFSYILYFTSFIFVPCQAITMLAIHYLKIWPYLMYSRKLVLLISLLFMGCFSLLAEVFHCSHIKSLGLTVISVIAIIIVVKCIFLWSYGDYQLRFENYYKNQPMDKRADTIVTLLLYAIGISFCYYISIVI